MHTYLTKDVTTLEEPFILLHIANNKGVMGKGVAAAITTKWPQVKKDYQEFFKLLRSEPALGGVVLTQVSESGYVLSLIAQDGYGNDGKRYLDYGALAECIERVSRIVKGLALPVYAPYGIGCGLAGGSWEVVEAAFNAKLNVNYCKH
jgi:O-acetyl-ADP-ribose deacetylase (regulator of RNase III)